MTSTGTLIAALQAREVEKVSQVCPFNRTGQSTEPQLTNTPYNGQNWNSPTVSVIRGSTVLFLHYFTFDLNLSKVFKYTSPKPITHVEQPHRPLPSPHLNTDFQAVHMCNVQCSRPHSVQTSHSELQWLINWRHKTKTSRKFSQAFVFLFYIL